MLRIVCKSKVHSATVTHANVNYAGSLTLDLNLMRAVDIVPYEQVHVLNITSGERLVTYCIEGSAGSGIVCANGAAARLISVGDKIIVLAYGSFQDSELNDFKPKIIRLDNRNRILSAPLDAALSENVSSSCASLGVVRA